MTDGGYAAVQDSHVVSLNKNVASLSRLLVFLPGTGAQARHYLLFPRLAANLGYHCINLAYPNAEAAASCASVADQNCYTLFRREVCYGTPGSDQVNVDSLNSIYTRLLKTLIYLNATYPNDGWGQFLSVSGDPIAWNKVVTAGHSQGSGHALMLGKDRVVNRVIMFAGPQDYNYVNGNTANWISATGKTPVNGLYSFLHLRDEVSLYSVQYKALDAMGLLGISDSLRVDFTTAPYQQSHTLYTDATPKNSGMTGAYHNAPVVDFYTPGTLTNPDFTAVWTYLLTAANSTGIQENQQAGFRLYPNPASGEIRIQTTEGDHQIQLIDITGKTIKNYRETGSLITIDVSKMAAGMYSVVVDGVGSKMMVE